MLLWCDGFDHYGTTVARMLDGIYSDASGSLSATARTGARSFRLTALRRILGLGYETVGIGYAIRLDALPSTPTGVILARLSNSSDSSLCRIACSTTGQVVVLSGGSTTVVASSAPVLVTTAWQHIEMKVKCHLTLGAVEVKVNGVTILNVSNIDTTGGTTGDAAQVRISDSAGLTGVNIDDIYAWNLDGSYNNDFIGDLRCSLIQPDADTAVADWTPNSGSVGYNRINEASPDDTTYIAATNPGEISEFGNSNIPADISNIAALYTYTRMLKTDAGASNVQVSIISNSAVDDGVDRPVTTAATYWMDLFEEDPDTSAPWTKSAVDACLIRFTKTV